MKRSIKTIAAFVVLSVFFVSCTDDLDTTPSNPVQQPSSFAALQGDWELVNNDNSNGGHTLHFKNDLAIQKLSDGSLVRASLFQIVKSENGNKLVYGKSQIGTN